MNIMQMENGIMNITQKDRELLFKDLSARLPYHVRVKVWLKDGTTEKGILDLEHNYADVLRDAFYYNKIVDIKPYLRPVSSMTEAENDDLYESGGRACWKNGSEIRLNELAGFKETYRSLIWLVRNHFDCFNLIGQDLAVEISKNNNPYEKDNCK